MKIANTRRFNNKIKGSYEVEVWLKDWECSILIGALKHYVKNGRSVRTNKPLPKGTITFVKNHLQKGFSEALGAVLKAEFMDLKKQKIGIGNKNYLKDAEEALTKLEIPLTQKNIKNMSLHLCDLDNISRVLE